MHLHGLDTKNFIFLTLLVIALSSTLSPGSFVQGDTKKPELLKNQQKLKKSKKKKIIDRN
jgi:hypothetical protein